MEASWHQVDSFQIAGLVYSQTCRNNGRSVDAYRNKVKGFIIILFSRLHCSMFLGMCEVVPGRRADRNWRWQLQLTFIPSKTFRKTLLEGCVCDRIMGSWGMRSDRPFSFLLLFCISLHNYCKLMPFCDCHLRLMSSVAGWFMDSCLFLLRLSAHVEEMVREGGDATLSGGWREFGAWTRSWVEVLCRVAFILKQGGRWWKVWLRVWWALD